MRNQFFEKPILNSPYEHPNQHWELNEAGQPTQRVISNRRSADFVTPIPKPKRQKGAQEQISILNQDHHASIINGVREQVDKWRMLPNPADWKVTPETTCLLQHWRHHQFAGIRPFFCQVEAVETAIWLTEVAPK